MSSLVTRVQNILLTPKTEWPVIAAEPETTAGLFTRYILIVSALGPIAMFLKGTLIGTSIPFVGTFRVGMGAGISMAVLSYVLGLVGIFVFSAVINALAPTFGGQKDSVQALKAAAYGATGAWVGSVAQIVPWIGWLIALAAAFYSIYLLYLGLPQTMKSPADKAAGYTAVSIVVAILLYWVIMAIVGSITARGLFGATGLPAITSSAGSFEKSSAGAALEQWSKQVEAAGKNVEASADKEGVPAAAAVGALVGAVVSGGKGTDALPTDRLKAYLPASLAGLPRTSLSAERNAALGFQVSEASAEYSDGAGRTLRLKINDTGGAKGLVALADWAGAEQEREWSGGYERDYRANGRMVHERWDSANGNGEYGLIVGQRFSVQVAGQAASMDELKAALAAGVDIAGLEAAASQSKPAG
jgi:Yip1 domain